MDQRVSSQHYFQSKKILALKAICIPFMGRLGNQLFQLSIGLYLTKYLNRVVFYTDSLNKSRANMLGDIVSQKSKIRFTRFQFFFIRIFSRFHSPLIVEETVFSDFSFSRIRKSSRFAIGYFQNYKYVDAVKVELLNILKKSELFADVIPRTQKDEIAVHMRYGDYAQDLKTKKSFGLTATSYYVHAVQLLLKSEKNYKKIVIYSDESEHALAEFTKAYGKSDIPVVASEFSKEHDDLREMAGSSGIVISNSTFSWWAAWIGSNCIGSTVIAPRPWLAKPSAYDEKLIPSNWVVIERELQP